MEVQRANCKQESMTEIQTGEGINTTSTTADRVTAVYYTDPLCCWSWAMEPEWQELKNQFPSQLSVRYCMGGMLPDWNSYHDTINSISRPVQMGPLWMEVRHKTGAVLQDRIWMTDPPASSFPACIAVKCAELQGVAFGAQLLRLLREAVMVEGKNISRNAVLLETASKMPEPFDCIAFEKALLSGSGIEPFRRDLDEINKAQITRFPCLILSAKGRSIMITGFRKVEVLKRAVEQLIS